MIERDGRYLVCRRTAGRHLAGYWEFPGGKRRPGESWRACLSREVWEELNVGVEVIAPLEAIRFRYADRRVFLRPFRCKLVAGTPRALASTELRWVGASGLRRMRFPPANRRLLATLAAPESAGCGKISVR